MRDVALVPEGDVLQSGQTDSIARHAPVRRSSRPRSDSVCAASRTNPFGPALNPSCTSRTSVRCRCRSSTATNSHVAADRRTRIEELGMSIAGDHLRRRDGPQAEGVTDEALRPPAGCSNTCRPRRSASSPRPTSRAARRRVRSRSTWAAHSATLAPNVVGSAWMPCVRPIITVSRWVSGERHERAQQFGRRVDQQVGRRRSSPSRAPCRRRRTTSGRSGSTTDAGWPIAACTTSTNAATSWSVTASRSSTACDERLVDDRGARSRQAAASSDGTMPSAAWPSVASSSTSSQRPKRRSSDHTASISGVE